MENSLRELTKKWFGDERIAVPLASALREARRYQTDRTSYGSPAQRREKLGAVLNAAKRLDKHLGGIDLETRRHLFGGTSIGEAPSQTGESRPQPSAVANVASVAATTGFAAMLGQLIEGAGRIIDGIEPQSAGTPAAPDPIAFAVECLASFWIKHRGVLPTNSFKRDAFGTFVEEALTLGGIEVPGSDIRTAVRRGVTTVKCWESAAHRLPSKVA